jgi:hypothetical protein
VISSLAVGIEGPRKRPISIGKLATAKRAVRNRYGLKSPPPPRNGGVGFEAKNDLYAVMKPLLEAAQEGSRAARP